MNQTDMKTASLNRSGMQSLQQSEIETLKKAFAKEGYFVIENVVPPEKLSDLHKRIVEEFNRTKQSGALFSGGGQVSGHLNCFPGEESRFIYDALQARGIIDLIKEIEPMAARMPNVGCNLNLPQSAMQHYHTDRDFTRGFMIANIAVVDTTVENGAIEIIPGTHNRLYRYWQFLLERPYRNSIRIPMKQGDIMVRTSNVWHRGMPNRTATPRPMIALTWEDGGSMQEDPFANGDGQIKFHPNWFKPTKLGRMRERLFVKVPLSYSAFRFIRSLYDKNY